MSEKTVTEKAQAISDKLEGFEQELQNIKTALEGKYDAEEVKAIMSSIDDVKEIADSAALEINSLKNGKGEKDARTVEEVVKEKFEELKTVFTEGRVKTFNVTKADLLASTAITNSTAGQMDPNVSPLAHRKLTMYDLFRKIPVAKDNGGSVKYIDWDEATTARAAAMIAEGGVFPESTAKWAEFSIDLKKVGDTIPVSEEMLVDHAKFAGELEEFLATNVALEIDDQLLNGAGTTVNMFGVKTRATAYTAPASGMTDASIYDLIPKIAEDITKGKGSKFRPNIALMNLSTINSYKLKKDANNNYIVPPFVDRSGNVIDGIAVIENNNVPDNEVIVGDSRYARIYEGAEGYSITVGEVDAQFAEDMKTLKARKRMNLLIKGSEQAAWRKVASISAALVLLNT